MTSTKSAARRSRGLQTVQCQQCGRPALFLVGPEQNIALCLDCNRKLYELQQLQLGEMERALNHTVDQMEAIAGIPLGGKFPPRPKPTILTGGFTFTNVHVTDSQIGVLNTGSVGSIDSAITLVKKAGAADLAASLSGLTDAVAKNRDLTDQKKREAVDLVSLIASEAAAPPEQRRPSVVRAVVVDLAQILSGVASGATLWITYGGAIKTFFGIE